MTNSASEDVVGHCRSSPLPLQKVRLLRRNCVPMFCIYVFEYQNRYEHRWNPGVNSTEKSTKSFVCDFTTDVYVRCWRSSPTTSSFVRWILVFTPFHPATTFDLCLSTKTLPRYYLRNNLQRNTHYKLTTCASESDQSVRWVCQHAYDDGLSISLNEYERGTNPSWLFCWWSFTTFISTDHMSFRSLPYLTTTMMGHYLFFLIYSSLGRQ